MCALEQMCRVFLVFLFIKITQNASLSLSEQKKYKSLIEGQGLFTLNDGVEILTSHNFNTEIYGQNHVWLVEFYNSWCGFCQRFAPSWKALANDIKDWNDLVKIGAIDCSDDENSNICRDFEIMAYPTLLYFHENYKQGPTNHGDEVSKGVDVNSHRDFLVQKLISEQYLHRGKILPHLLPLQSGNYGEIFENVPEKIQYGFVIIEPPRSYLGPTVAMDLHKIDSISVRYALTNNTALVKKLQVTVFPAVVAIYKNNKQVTILSGDFKTKVGIGTAILNFLESKNVKVPTRSPMPQIYTGKWADVQVPDISSLMEARERDVLAKKIKTMGDVIFQMDLETALRVSLKTEVGRMKKICGEKLIALKNYLNVLAKYFPFGRNGRLFLKNVKEKVNEANKEINGEVIFEMVKEAEKESSKVFSSPEQWMACRGSQANYRGFPCGLWKLFHFLTVASADNSNLEENPDPLEILNAMHGYVKNFFGCADCSRHFQEMAKKKGLTGVQSRESAVVWLWMAHNTANKRLAGDQTEDPEYPKVQFPLAERCPQCRNGDGSWNYPEVMKYLKHVYSAINVRYIGSDSRILHLGLEGSMLNINGSNNVFQKIDTSMCFIIYVISFGLIVILIQYFLKRGYRKKMYVHDILGKV